MLLAFSLTTHPVSTLTSQCEEAPDDRFDGSERDRLHHAKRSMQSSLAEKTQLLAHDDRLAAKASFRGRDRNVDRPAANLRRHRHERHQPTRAKVEGAGREHEGRPQPSLLVADNRIEVCYPEFTATR